MNIYEGMDEHEPNAMPTAEQHTMGGGRKSRRGGRKSRRGGRKSRRGGRKSRRGGRKSRRGGRKSRRSGMKKSAVHKKSKSRRGGRKSRRGGMNRKHHSMKPVHHKSSVGGSRMKKHPSKRSSKRYSKTMSAGKRRTCPKYCRRKTVRCKSYRRVHRRHGKSHRRR